MDKSLKQNLSAGSTWMRALYIVLFAIFYSIAEIVIAVVVVFQFLMLLFTGSPNARLLDFGQGLSTYVYQVMRYLTFNSHARPFPFSDWPGADDAADTAEPGHGPR